jgi:uncharacterized HAD superfamily protein
MKKNCFCFDLDGTICNVNHRRQYVATKPRNWESWNKGIKNDVPNQAVELVYKSLYLNKGIMDFDLFFVSGRSDDYRPQTEEWLEVFDFKYDALYMRKYKDHRDDAVVKGEIADEIEKTHVILGVFDDRERVVKHWQSRGIWVFDVGQGKGQF